MVAKKTTRRKPPPKKPKKKPNNKITHKSVGYPPKLTRALIKEIAKYLEGGNFAETAAAAVGITRVTYYAWLRKGARAKSGLHYDFAQAVNLAMAKGEVGLIDTVKKAGKKDWKAAAWIAGRRHHKKWGKRKQIEITAGEGVNPINLIMPPMPGKAKIEGKS